MAATTAVLRDVGVALKLVSKSSGASVFRSWVIVPVGILLMLLACFAADVVLKIAGSSFPASVAVLIILFLSLLASEWVLGPNRTRRVVALIDVPAGWSLRWINVFFTPTFILLPLSPPIGIVEVMKIIAVFVIGFIAMMVMTAYMTRGLQILVGAPKRAHAPRADELGGNETDEIPISTISPVSLPSSAPISTSNSAVALDSLAGLVPARPESIASVRSQLGYSSSPPPNFSAGGSDLQTRVLSQTPLPPPRAQRWAAIVSGHLPWTIYLATLALVGLPVYYAADYAMPLHLSATVLAYFAAMTIPLRWRQYLHPVLVSALITVLSIWVLGLMRGDSLQTTLLSYRVNLKYLQLWRGATRSDGKLPGAGDVLGTVLDAGIVALALPMYQYRRELREHFIAIAVPNVLVSIGSLFAYPSVCYAIGIGAERSLAFAARSLTLALAMPAIENVGGDVHTVAAIAICSGIVGAIWGPWMLKMMRISEDDYVTRGVTLGLNSSAIATALLLRTDPRAAALSSLSMSLFGTVTVLFTSIPPIVAVVRSLVGL